MDSHGKLAEYLESTVNPWFWKDYHKRGALSHFIRARKVGACGKGADSEKDWSEVWVSIGFNQSLSLLSSTLFLELSQEARTQMEFSNSIPSEDRKDSLPLGAVSPLGTEAGLDALLHVAEISHTLGHFRNLTIPFIIATIREALTLFLSYAVLSAPVIYAWRNYDNPTDGKSLLVVLILGIVSGFLSFEFNKMFKLLV